MRSWQFYLKVNLVARFITWFIKWGGFFKILLLHTLRLICLLHISRILLTDPFLPTLPLDQK